MTRRLHGLLFLLFAACFQPASAQKRDELLPFQRYYPSAQSAAERKEAVLTLEGLEGPGVFAALYPKFADKQLEPDVAEAIVRVLAGFRTEANQKLVFDTLRTEKALAGKLALLQVIARGAWKDRAGVVLAQLAFPSWEVRRRALEALQSGGDASGAQKVAGCCDDPVDAVRFVALDVLAGWNSPLVVPRAIALLGDPSRQVRQSAIRALGTVRSTDSVGPLVARLQKEEGVLQADIADALAKLTGREFGLHADLWAQWWSGIDPAHYEIPTAEGVAFLRGHRRAQSGGGGWDGPDTKPGGRLFPVRTPSRAIVFVIDCSGSMEALVTERERWEGEKFPDFSRMEIVKAELAREVESLPANVRFNIIAFATDVRSWKASLQPANVMVKYAAKEWIKNLHALGGSSRADLATAGLPGASGIEQGKTNAFDALRVALGVEDLRTADANYAKTEVDTIFFLSDGRPTAGTYVDPDDVLRGARAQRPAPGRDPHDRHRRVRSELHAASRGAERAGRVRRSRALGGIVKKEAPSASALISARIAELGDWRGKTLARVRKLVHDAVPDVVEEWKWMGTPVWSRGGILCTGESYKSVVKLTFHKGAALKDPAGLFNASLEGNARRAIDLREGDTLDAKAFVALVRAAAALHAAPKAKPAKKRKS